MVNRCIRYGNNRNRVFVIDIYKNHLKIVTYRKGINGCNTLYAVHYFPRNSVINFSGNAPFIQPNDDIRKHAPSIWNSRNVYNKWRELMNGNEWQLYQKQIQNEN